MAKAKKILNNVNFLFGWELEFQNADLKEVDSELDDEAWSDAVNEEANELQEKTCDDFANEGTHYYGFKGKLQNFIRDNISTREELLDACASVCADLCGRNSYYSRTQRVYKEMFDRIKDAVNEAIDSAIDYDDIREFNTDASEVDDVCEIIENNFHTISKDRVFRELYENLTVNDAYHLVYADYATDYINEVTHDAASSNLDQSDYQTEGSSFDLPWGLECVGDGSVDGGEIRPKGRGVEFDKAVVMLQNLERDYNFEHTLEVDKECSFHVHVSNTAIKHKYGESMQCFMYEYLHRNMYMLPDSVIERLSTGNKSWRDRYFKIAQSRDKYTAIHCHVNCGTWEHRYMGNIKSAAEGKQCLEFARDCYANAYKKAVLLGKVSSFVDNVHALEANIEARADALLAKKQRQLANG